MRLYISGALQASRDLDAARARYEHAAAVVADAGHVPYLPHQFTDPQLAGAMTPGAVFARDRDELSRADAIIAYLDEPSLGVGCELALAHHQGVSILALHHTEARVSRFALGYLESIGAAICAYRSPDDVVAAIRKFLSSDQS